MPAALSRLSLPASPRVTPAPRCCQNCGSAAPKAEQKNLAGEPGRAQGKGGASQPLQPPRGSERWHLEPFPAGIAGGHGGEVLRGDTEGGRAPEPSPAQPRKVPLIGASAAQEFYHRGTAPGRFLLSAPVYPTPRWPGQHGTGGSRCRERVWLPGFVHLAGPELLPQLLIPGEHRSELCHSRQPRIEKHQVPNLAFISAAERKIPLGMGVWGSGSHGPSCRVLSCTPSQALSCSQHSFRMSLTAVTSPCPRPSAPQSPGTHQEVPWGPVSLPVTAHSRHSQPRAVPAPGMGRSPPGPPQHIPAAGHGVLPQSPVWEEIWCWIRGTLRMRPLGLAKHKKPAWISG